MFIEYGNLPKNIENGNRSIFMIELNEEMDFFPFFYRTVHPNCPANHIRNVLLKLYYLKSDNEHSHTPRTMTNRTQPYLAASPAVAQQRTSLIYHFNRRVFGKVGSPKTTTAIHRGSTYWPNQLSNKSVKQIEAHR